MQKKLLKFLKFIIKSQILVSLCGTFLALFLMLKNNMVQCENLIIIFYTLLCGYLYTKFQNSRNLSKILVLSCVLGCFCSFIILKFSGVFTFLKWIFIIILGGLYNSKILPKNIRQIPLLKAFYIGGLWALLFCFFSFQPINIIDFSVVALWVSALVLPFDIRDIYSDSIITFPKIIGIKNTQYLSYGLLFIATIIAVFHFPFMYGLAMFFSLIYCFILIYFAQPKNPDIYFSLGIEIGLAMPLLFLILIKFIFNIN